MTTHRGSASTRSPTIDIAESVLANDVSFLTKVITAETSPHRLVAALEGLAALNASLPSPTIADLIRTTGESTVRRTLALHFTITDPEIHEKLLCDEDASVVEAAVFSAGESGADRYRSILERIAVDHHDPLCRESAIAALGNIGDPRSLHIVLQALLDRPTIRRRAVVALSAFDDPEVELALERAKSDKDFQVRNLAEDLLRPPV